MYKMDALHKKQSLGQHTSSVLVCAQKTAHIPTFFFNIVNFFQRQGLSDTTYVCYVKDKKSRTEKIMIINWRLNIKTESNKNWCSYINVRFKKKKNWSNHIDSTHLLPMTRQALCWVLRQSRDSSNCFGHSATWNQGVWRTEVTRRQTENPVKKKTEKTKKINSYC